MNGSENGPCIPKIICINKSAINWGGADHAARSHVGVAAKLWLHIDTVRGKRVTEVKIINVHSTKWLSFSLAIVGWSNPVYRWESSLGKVKEREGRKHDATAPNFKGARKDFHPLIFRASMPRFSPSHWGRPMMPRNKLRYLQNTMVLPAMLSPNGYDSCCGWILRRRHWHVGRKKCKQCIRKATFSIGMTNLSVDYRRS